MAFHRLNKAFILGVLLTLFAGGASAQHYLGVKGGYSGGYARFDYAIRRNWQSEFLFGWPTAGISWKYYTEERVVGAVQADLQYLKKGYRILKDARPAEEGFEYYEYYDRTLTSVELPFMWHIHLYAFKQRARFFINLGIYAGYILDSADETWKRADVNSEWIQQQSGKYHMNSVRDNRVEYGLCGGLGFSYSFGRYEIFAEGRYNFGYGDILRSRSKHPEYDNEYNRSPVDMINVSMGLYYRLGKGGLKAFENPRVRTPKKPWHEGMPQGPKK